MDGGDRAAEDLFGGFAVGLVVLRAVERAVGALGEVTASVTERHAAFCDRLGVLSLVAVAEAVPCGGCARVGGEGDREVLGQLDGAGRVVELRRRPVHSRVRSLA